ncbi:MAG: acyl carrier protein [Holophagaceae bacterium]|nr:acyl carrier protein [Holophagaceae bacterium]
MLDITSKEDVFNAIVDILERDFECSRESLVPDANLFEDLNLDSIDAVDLIVKLKKIAKLDVTPEDFMQIRTLRDTTEVVHRILNNQQN